MMSDDDDSLTVNVFGIETKMPDPLTPPSPVLDDPIPFPISPPPTELRPKDTARIKLVIDNTGPRCEHRRYKLDPTRREVSCGLCGAPLTAFEILLEVAKDHERASTDLRHAKNEAKAVWKRIEELKRIEQNARQRAKRAGAAVPDRWVLDRILDGSFPAWATDGVVSVQTANKMLTPDEARTAATKLLRLAKEAEAQNKNGS